MDFWQWLSIGGDFALEYAAGIVILSSATAAIAKLAKRALHPKKKIEERLDTLEEHSKHVDKCLNNDNKRLTNIESDTKLTLRGMLQLITHEIDGNHVDKLAELRDEGIEYLIKR